jgi:hypothetical protein
LSGLPSDLPVSLCAVQLAARTESEIYALQDFDQLGLRHCDAPLFRDPAMTIDDSLQESFRLLGELTEAQKVPVSYHILERGAENSLGELLIDHAVSCLVVYADQKKFPDKRIPWIDELQKRLNDSPRWFHGILQVIVAPPWNEMDMEAIISQMHHLNRVSGKKKIKIVK